MKKLRLVTFAILCFCTGSLYVNAQENTITLQTDKAKDIISKDIYGHFAEHLGRCVYEGIWVGENSPIPNTKGYRNDVLAALKGMNIPVLRWPGGCFADTYHWKEGIGPKDKRASIINVNWGGYTEDNSFGTHEFLDLCELLDCDAYISGNVGSGTVQEMTEWLEYMTSSAESPMTKLRKQNGREKPWNVKYLGIGNEAWGCGGNMTPEFYSDLCRQFATYLSSSNGKVIKIASGASDFDYNWTDVLMKKIGPRVQAVSLHYYTLPGNWTTGKGSAINFKEDAWFTVLRKTLLMDSIVREHIAVMDKYDKEKKMNLMVDEWGTWYDQEPGDKSPLYQQNTLRDAIAAAVNLNIFNNYASRVKMTNIAQVINVLQAMILTKKEQMILTPTYHVFRMFKVHQNATLIPLSLNCRNYKYGNESIPSISASASKDASGKIHITLTNLDPNAENPVTIDLGSLKNVIITGEVITSKEMNDRNDFGSEKVVAPVKFDKFKLSGSKLVVSMPSKSVVGLEMTTK